MKKNPAAIAVSALSVGLMSLYARVGDARSIRVDIVGDWSLPSTFVGTSNDANVTTAYIPDTVTGTTEFPNFTVTFDNGLGLTNGFLFTGSPTVLDTSPDGNPLSRTSYQFDWAAAGVTASEIESDPSLIQAQVIVYGEADGPEIYFAYSATSCPSATATFTVTGPPLTEAPEANAQLGQTYQLADPCAVHNAPDDTNSDVSFQYPIYGPPFNVFDDQLFFTEFAAASSPPAVSEPAAFGLFGLGLMGIACAPLLARRSTSTRCSRRST